MAAGRLVDESDQESIALVGGDVVAVDDFPDLGSVIAGSGRMDVDVDRRVAQASKAFGAQSHCNQLSGCCGRGGYHGGCVCVCFFPAMVGLSRGGQQVGKCKGGVWQSCTAACRAGILTGEHGI